MNERDEKIRTRAHELWEHNGKPEGSEMDFWLQAEREIDAETGGNVPGVPPHPVAVD